VKVYSARIEDIDGKAVLTASYEDTGTCKTEQVQVREFAIGIIFICLEQSV
jgi:hypothetical protein